MFSGAGGDELTTSLAHDGKEQITDRQGPEGGEDGNLSLFESVMRAVAEQLHHFRRKADPKADGIERQQSVIKALGILNRQIAHAHKLPFHAYAGLSLRTTLVERAALTRSASRSV